MKWTGPPQQWHEPDPWDAIAIGLHALTKRCPCQRCWIAAFDSVRTMRAERRYTDAPRAARPWAGAGGAAYESKGRGSAAAQQQLAYATAYARAARGEVHRVFGVQLTNDDAPAG